MQRQASLGRIVYMRGRTDKLRGFVYGGGILDDGTHVIGFIPLCTTQKFTWNLSNDKALGEHGFKGHTIFGKPNIHKGRVSMPLTLVTNDTKYEHLPEECQKEIRRSKPERTPLQMLYVSFDAIVNYSDSIACVQKDEGILSLDKPLVQDIIGRLTNWRDIVMMPQGDFNMPRFIREETSHSGTNVEYYYSTAHAQFARIFETLFGLSFYDIQKIRPVELAAYYRHLCSRGAAYTFEPHQFVNRLCNVEANTSDPFAGSAYERFTNMNVSPSLLNRTFTVQTPLRTALRIYKQQKNFGLASVDPVDSDGTRLPSSNNEGSSTSLAELLKRVDKTAQVVGSKRSNSFAGDNENGPSKRIGKTKKSSVFELEVKDPTSGTVLISTDWRKTRVKLPDFTKISDDDWIDCQILTTLRNVYPQNGHMCLDYESFEAMICEANADGFPAKLTRVNVWSRVLHLFSDGKVAIFDATEGIHLTSKDMEDLMLNYESMPVHLLVGLCEIITEEKETVQLLNDFVENWKDDKQTMNAVTRQIKYIDEVFVPGSPYAQMKLSDGQWEALVKALISPLSFISGPGGTGKSTLMQIISLAFRSCGFHGTFLYTMFKNGTRVQTKYGLEKSIQYVPDVISTSPASSVLLDRHQKITTDAWGAQDGENVCATCDSIILNRFRHAGRKLAIEVLIVEESSMISMSHLHHLLMCIDLRILKRIVMIGDKEQLAALQPGEPFKHLVEALPNLSVTLTSGFRTNSGVITKLLDCVRECNIEDMRFDDPDDPNGTCFVHMDAFENTHKYARSSAYVLEKYKTAVLEILAKIDPEKQKYDEIMPVTTYNDMARFVSCVMHSYYFNMNLSLRQSVDYATAKAGPKTENDKKNPEGQEEEEEEDNDKEEKGDDQSSSKTNAYKKNSNRTILPIVTGSRVVILISDKEKDLARGNIGKVTLIIDHSYVTPTHDFQSHPSVQSTAQPLTRNCTHRTIIIDGKLRITFRGAQGYTSTLEPGGCITIHRSQGSEYPIVFAFFPSGKNLVNNRVLYTAISRTRNECHVFGSYDHINKMITTPATVPHNTFKKSLQVSMPHDVIEIIQKMVSEYYDSIISMFRHTDLTLSVQTPADERDDQFDDLDDAAWNQIHDTIQQRQKANMMHKACSSKKN